MKSGWEPKLLTGRAINLFRDNGLSGIEFFEKHGYQVFTQLENQPTGQICYYMRRSRPVSYHDDHTCGVNLSKTGLYAQIFCQSVQSLSVVRTHPCPVEIMNLTVPVFQEDPSC